MSPIHLLMRLIGNGLILLFKFNNLETILLEIMISNIIPLSEAKEPISVALLNKIKNKLLKATQ